MNADDRPQTNTLTVALALLALSAGLAGAALIHQRANAAHWLIAASIICSSLGLANDWRSQTGIFTPRPRPGDE